ncbi:Thioredoxin-like protein 1 [Desmophyllum pertusum]|uniref:Thioredoxin-like protein 1 n=1 Tax=Desmophyllum pertusum TaxID=174260 RepID=A0A9W9YT16_9CNID|nr:Thioredoxin-like protein 1 [Desmophyllum pertusum]
MKEMGYDIVAAENALIATKNKGIQPAIDWINQNPDKARVKLQQSGANVAADVPHGDAQSISQHSLASSSSTAPAAAVHSRYQNTIDERHKFQEKLRLEAIEEAKLEKQRKKLHKENLLKNMKEEKDEKLEKAKHARLTENTAEPSTNVITDQQCSDGESAMVELRIRIPDGQVLSVSFPSNTTIQTLYQEVKKQLPSSNSQSLDDFVLMTSFPQRRISDMESTLEAAGLAPRAALVVQRTDQQGVLTQGEGPVYSIRNITKIDDWQGVLSEQGKLVVVQFYASWCSLCRSVSDSYDSLNASYGINGQVLFVRVNVDEFKVLKYQQRVTSLPTFKLFRNEKAIAHVEGTDMEELKQQIEAAIKEPRDCPRDSPMDMIPQEEPPMDDDPR